MTAERDAAAGSPNLGWRALAPACRRAGLSMAELYIRYVALGGSASSIRFAHHVGGGSALDVDEHDLAVLALNERFLEMEQLERLPYAGGG